MKRLEESSAVNINNGTLNRNFNGTLNIGDGNFTGGFINERNGTVNIGGGVINGGIKNS